MKDQHNPRPTGERAERSHLAMSALQRCLLGLGLVLLTVSSPAQAAKNVLLLNSYHPTYTWTASLVEGVRDGFAKRDDIELQIDFLDTKKSFTPEYQEKLRELLAERYAKLKIDLLISSDDDALDFLLKYRGELFPGVPIVFCGVNNFKDSRLAGQRGFTGVNEANDMNKGVGWILQQRPLTKRIVVVHDQSATGLSVAKQLAGIETNFAGKLRFEYVTGVTKQELSDRLRKIPGDASVIWGVFLRDKAGVPLSPRESMRLVTAAAPVPVYTFWDFAVIEGAVGGYVVSSYEQGMSATRLADQVFSGTPIDQVPIIRQSPNVYMFDYRALARWQLDPAKLPAGAVVRHRPFSFYETYKQYVWAALGGMGVESLAIIALALAIRGITRKSRAKLRASEERYRSIVEDGTEFIGRLDTSDRWLFVNGALARLVDEDQDAMLGQSLYDLIPVSARDEIRASLAHLGVNLPTTSIEHRLETADKTLSVLWTCRALLAADGRRREVQLVGSDVTARRRAEDALRTALEKVELGNAQLSRVNTELQGVLDNMREALFVIELDGRITPTCSKLSHDWFGKPGENVRVWDYLIPTECVAQAQLQIGIEQIAEDFLPLEVSLAQLPTRFIRDGATFELECQPVFRDGRLAELIMIVADITERCERERADALTRELPGIVGNLLRDRAGFQSFVADTEELFARLGNSEDPVEQRRTLHTLKGNSAIYGFLRLSQLCHGLEDAMQRDSEEPLPESLEALVSAWRESLETVGVFLTDEGDDTIRVARREYEELITRLAGRDDYSALVQIAKTWVYPPFSQALSLYPAQAERLAHRLSKQVHVTIEDRALRLPSSTMRGFLGSLVHVVRNAIDHGLERPDERVARGKSSEGQLTIGCTLEGRTLTVYVADDGNGIDWEAIRRKAKSLGLPATTSAELVAALLSDGVTTKSEVSELSGRGVGLAATSAACRAIGGTTHVESEPQKGTRFEFVFSLERMAMTVRPPAVDATSGVVRRSLSPKTAVRAR